jgi:SAM-dependent methyltransferase
VSVSGDDNKYWIDRAAGQPITDFSVSPDARSAGYERWSRDKLRRWTLHQLERNVSNWSHYVDLGCGFGDFTALFGAKAAKVTACDLAPAFAAEAQRRLDALGHRDAKVHASDVVSFDDYAGATVVYLGGVLTYLNRDDTLAVLRRLRSRVTDDAVVAQRDWCVIGFGREKVNRGDNKYSEHRRPSTYVDLFREAGFALIKKRISPFIYGEQMTRDALRASWLVGALGWLPQGLWRLGTLHWYDCSATFLYRPA